MAIAAAAAPGMLRLFKREHRFRSLSASIDAGCSETFYYPASDDRDLVASVALPVSTGHNFPLITRSCHSSPSLSDTTKRTKACPILPTFPGIAENEIAGRCCSKTGAQALSTERDGTGFPFQDLPDLCKAKVLSFLSPMERGKVATTCREWSHLIRDPYMWPIVDLNVFPACSKATPHNAVSSERQHECTVECYNTYCERVSLFIKYLIKIKPVVRILRFRLDIGDSEDRWNELLTSLIKSSRCKQMIVADFTWNETPAKKSFLCPDTSVTWSNSDYKELTFRRRIRQRHFSRFFDLLTAAAPNITILQLPFDWSDRTVQLLGRLRSLHTLDLRKYFLYGYVKPELLLCILKSCTMLRRFTLEMMTEMYGGNSPFYAFESTSLEFLDISACHSIYISEMALPKLTELRAAPFRHNIPGFPSGLSSLHCLFNQQGQADAPCLYDVLSRGASTLRSINGHQLPENWTSYVVLDLEFERIMASVCACRVHRVEDNLEDLRDDDMELNEG